MVRPAQTQPEVVKEEEKKPIKREYSEEEKRHIMMKDEFKKFIDRAVRVTERALYYNEPSDIFADYSGAREKHERYAIFIGYHILIMNAILNFQVRIKVEIVCHSTDASMMSAGLKIGQSHLSIGRPNIPSF